MAPGDAVWKQNLAPAEVFTTRQRAHGSPACSVGVEFFFPFLFSLTCAKISLGSVPIRPWRTKKKAPSLKTTHHPQQGEKLKREGEGGLPGSGQLGSRSFTARASGNSPGSWLPGAEGCARLQVLLSHGTSVNLPSHTLHPFPVPWLPTCRCAHRRCGRTPGSSRSSTSGRCSGISPSASPSSCCGRGHSTAGRSHRCRGR